VGEQLKYDDRASAVLTVKREEKGKDNLQLIFNLLQKFKNAANYSMWCGVLL
jgi:hypothetical protein